MFTNEELTERRAFILAGQMTHPGGVYSTAEENAWFDSEPI